MTYRYPPASTTLQGLIELAGDLDGYGTTASIPKIGGLQGNPIKYQVLGAAQDGYALTWVNSDGYLEAKPITVTSGSITPGTAGQIFVTNSTPASAWTSLISYETTHGRFTAGGGGSDTSTVIGPLVTAETSYSAVWGLPHSVAVSVTNFMLASDGSNSYLNAPTGSIFYSIGGVTWASLTTSAMSWGDGGTVASIELVHGKVTSGGAGSNTSVVIGPAVSAETSQAAIYLLPNGVSATANAWSVLGNGTTTRLGFASGGSVAFSVPGVGDYATFTTSSFVMGGSNQVSMELVHGRITSGGTGSDFLAVIGPTPSFETTAASLWLLPNAGTPNGSNYILSTDGTNTYFGTPATSGNSYFWRSNSATVASLEGAHGKITSGGAGSDFKTVIGPLVSLETSAASIYLLPNATAATANNYALYGDGTNVVFNTVGSGGGASFVFYKANSVQLATLSSSTFTLAAPPTLQWSASVGMPTITQLTPGSDVGAQNLTISAQAPYASAVTHVDGGDLNFIIPTSISGSTKYGGVNVMYNAQNQISMGVYASGSLGPAYGIWAGVAPGPNNYILVGDAASAFLNAPSSSIYLRVAGSTYATMNATDLYLGGNTGTSADPIRFDWTTTTTPNLLAGTAATLLTVGTTKTSAQLQFNFGAASKALILDPAGTDTFYSADGYAKANIELTHGKITAGGNGSDYKAIIGPLVTAETNYAALYLLPGGTAPSGTNISLYSDGGNVGLNAPAGGSILFGISGFTYVSLSTAVMTWGASVTAALTQSAAASDVATQNFTITPMAPYASAATHVDAGDVVVNVPLSVSGTSKFGGLNVEYGGTSVFRMGVYGSATSFAGLWALDGGAPSTGNYTFLGNQSQTFFNVPSASGTMFFRANNASFLYTLLAASSLAIFGGATGLSSDPLVVGWGTSTTPTIQSGNLATSLTVGTTKSGASTILQGDNASTILTLSTSAVFSTKVLYDNVSTPAASAGGPIVFGSSGALKAVGTSGTITTMAAADLDGFKDTEGHGHCPACGTDFAVEWSNPKYGSLTVCINCLTEEIGERSWIIKKGKQ